MLPDILEDIYYKRYAWAGPLIAAPPKKDTSIIVVIPCYNELEIINSLESIEQCSAPDCAVEVIVVANHGEHERPHIKNFNIETVNKIEAWKSGGKRHDYHLIRAFDLPKKKAGVGLARKIGMDEAARRFDYLGERKGIIACFDADCSCSHNYLIEIYDTYKKYPATTAALLNFEHKLDQAATNESRSAIINYELHLRYYVLALKYAGFPYAFHTIGSCITVSLESYKKQGGMNTRKAGEDFYFLQRIFPLGNIRCINTATVFPSPRPSDRVPFGTGRAINDMLKNQTADRYHTYNPRTFIDLKSFIEHTAGLSPNTDLSAFLRKMPESLREYLEEIDFCENVKKLQKNYRTESTFAQAFYTWFNGFKVLKFVHFARDRFHPNVEILDAANWVLTTYSEEQKKDTASALIRLRQLDRLDK